MPPELPDLVADLEKRVADISHQVRYLKGKLDSLESVRNATRPIDPTICSEVLLLTRSLFGDDVRLVEKDDPELPVHSYAVLYVRTSLSDDEIASKEDDWHKLIRGIAAGRHSYFRLSVDAR